MTFRQNPEQFGEANSVKVAGRRRGVWADPEAGTGEELKEPGE